MVQLHEMRLYERQGNMAETWIGRYNDMRVIEKVLIDRLAAEERFALRFSREARATKFLSKITNVPEVLACGDHPKPWFIQKYIEGLSLSEWIAQKSYPLSKNEKIEAINILKKCADILDIANRYGFIHRDVTPSNIIVDSLNVPRIIDWGLFSFSNAFEVQCSYSFEKDLGLHPLTFRLTEYDRRHGCVGYAAPEQYKAFYDQPGQKNDIYSLAVVSIEMLFGLNIFASMSHDNEEIFRIQSSFSKKTLLNTVFGLNLSMFYTFLHSDIEKRNVCYEDFKRALDNITNCE